MCYFSKVLISVVLDRARLSAKQNFTRAQECYQKVISPGLRGREM